MPTKSPSLDNWLQLDPAIAITVRLDAEGRPHPATAADWFPPILNNKLSDKVPGPVRELYDTARGAMLFGLLFTPLFALATEELFRVCEAAVFHRANLAGAGKSTSKFRSNLAFLSREGILTREDQEMWESFRRARDFGSHLREQMAVNPAIAVQILEHVTEWINRLFSGA